MKSQTMKAAGGLAGAAMLVFSGATCALATADQALAVDADQGTAQAEADCDASCGFAGVAVSADALQGEFSFDQNVTTPNSVIAGAFRVATSAMCAAMPTYDVTAASSAIAVGGSAAGNAFEATIDEMETSEDAVSYIMGCACSANMPGGGAIVNAEVEGVSIASLMRLAQVQ